MTNWLDNLGYRDYTLSIASEDASFRSYYRVQGGTDSWILMDAPPEKEPCDRFIAVANKLRQAKLSAPEIIEQDATQGFLLFHIGFISLALPNNGFGLLPEIFHALQLLLVHLDAGGFHLLRHIIEAIDEFSIGSA